MTVTVTTAPETWPIASTQCIFRGHLMDYETAAFLLAMEAELGYTLTVEQGCYSNAVAASGGTHGGGQVVDLAKFDWERKVRVARSLGAFAWHRPFNWDGRGGGEHIHVGIRGGPTLSDAARVQQTNFDKKPRRNGLAGEPVDPDQFPPRPPATPTFRYPPKAPVTPTFRGVTLNDDWGNLASDVASVVRDVRPLVMGVQEGWRVDYAQRVRTADPSQPGRWHVRQVLDSQATAGVAILWDHRRLQTIGVSKYVAKKGWGIQEIGRGADTRMRSVIWQDLMFRDTVDRGALPKRFRLASVHRPPVRDRASWHDFDAVLGLWLKRSPLPVLLFTDCNEHGGPEPLMSSLHSSLSWHAVGDSIDGAITSLPVRGVKALPKRTSDHQPVVVTLG